MQSSWLQQASTFRQVARAHLDLEALCEARGKSLRWLDLSCSSVLFASWNL